MPDEVPTPTGQSATNGTSDSRTSNDLDRVERLFQRAMQIAVLFITVIIIGGATLFFTLNNQLNDIAKRNEDKVEAYRKDAVAEIERVSKRSADDIQAKVNEVSKTVTDNILNKLDINAIERHIISEELSRINNDMSQKITQILNNLTDRLDQFKISNDQIALQIKERDQKISDIDNRLSSMIRQVSVVEGIKIRILGISIAPTIPKIGEPAQLLVRIDVDQIGQREKPSLLQVSIDFKAFERQWNTEDTLITGQIKEISLPITIPDHKPNGNEKYGAGTYSVEVLVRSEDRKSFLAASSNSITVY
jgi:hypothetical protein